MAGRDLEELNTALKAPPHDNATWSLTEAANGLRDAGLDVVWSAEAAFTTAFHDIGALVLFLRMVPWQIPAFDVQTYAPHFRTLHESRAPLTATAHRFALLARTEP
ncbi:hypothetical protein ABZW11_28260 [Nonomuraea sp. NPDC004580]|uniref:hypothetical protein n=1 Tax=Nonomuraea sp. NPDC004580 TaxID=3154552 RepID=UPI0033A22C33